MGAGEGTVEEEEVDDIIVAESVCSESGNRRGQRGMPCMQGWFGRPSNGIVGDCNPANEPRHFYLAINDATR